MCTRLGDGGWAQPDFPIPDGKRLDYSWTAKTLFVRIPAGEQGKLPICRAKQPTLMVTNYGKVLPCSRTKFVQSSLTCQPKDLYK